MAVTVTLSDSISERLLNYARKSNLPLDALVEKLVDDALPVNRNDELNLPTDDQPSSFDDVLAQIRAIPPNADAITPATKSADELVATLEAEPPSDDLLTFEEMWPLWQNLSDYPSAASPPKSSYLSQTLTI